MEILVPAIPGLVIWAVAAAALLLSNWRRRRYSHRLLGATFAGMALAGAGPAGVLIGKVLDSGSVVLALVIAVIFAPWVVGLAAVAVSQSRLSGDIARR